jgi:hypothetical protein
LNSGQVNGARDAEIGDDGVTTREQDIFGLDVAVDDALTMSVGQSICGFARYLYGRINCDLPLAIDSRPQRLSADIRHEIVKQRVHVTRVVEREDVRMLQAGQRANFTDESQFAGL